MSLAAARAAAALSRRPSLLRAGSRRPVHVAGDERRDVPGPAHQRDDRRVDQHADAVQGAASQPARRDRRHVLHDRRRRRTFVSCASTGKYRDLVALVEFGNEAYVVTPFTNDYDNILLSISLIGDPVEYSLFPDQGTIIAQAIDQSIGLFKAFNFLDASGNLMVIFTDGEDTRAIVNGRTLDEIVQSTIDAKIPVYFVRTNYERSKGKVIPDELWIPAIEKTGGQFYAADNEDSLLNAIKEIDAVSAGTIRTTQYSSQRPRFAIFAFIAACCWTGAATLEADRAAVSEASVGVAVR